MCASVAIPPARHGTRPSEEDTRASRATEQNRTEQTVMMMMMMMMMPRRAASFSKTPFLYGLWCRDTLIALTWPIPTSVPFPAGDPNSHRCPIPRPITILLRYSSLVRAWRGGWDRDDDGDDDDDDDDASSRKRWTKSWRTTLLPLPVRFVCLRF